jgi:hypothetical protein
MTVRAKIFLRLSIKPEKIRCISAMRIMTTPAVKWPVRLNRISKFRCLKKSLYRFPKRMPLGRSSDIEMRFRREISVAFGTHRKRFLNKKRDFIRRVWSMAG